MIKMIPVNERNINQSHTVAVIGGGPAGLIAAEYLITHGINVDVFEGKPAVLRKFLVAGKGGLNLTRAEDFDLFLSRYLERASFLSPFLTKFGPSELRSWVEELGFSTFVGSSGRVFPSDMQAVPLRRAWIQRLEQQGVRFHLNHRWLGWNLEKGLIFQTKSGNVAIHPDAAVLALGGASWSKTGSDGKWSEILQKQGILISAFKPANCGFDVGWSEHFRDRYQGSAIKSVVLRFQPANGKPIQQKGEFLATKYGVEGNLIYSFSAPIRDEILSNGKAIIHLDLTPDWTQDQLLTKLSKPRGSRSIASHLEKSIGLRGVKSGLLWEFLLRSTMNNPEELVSFIKALPIPLLAPRPLEEAISSAGGVRFEDLNNYLMLNAMPGVFCAGEMLDWEAPTGGYLLTACFSTGRSAAEGVLNWLHNS
jgi:uncharacterized flavoprotein (TIGR03862 family)